MPPLESEPGMEARRSQRSPDMCSRLGLMRPFISCRESLSISFLLFETVVPLLPPHSQQKTILSHEEHSSIQERPSTLCHRLTYSHVCRQPYLWPPVHYIQGTACALICCHPLCSGTGFLASEVPQDIASAAHQFLSCPWSSS